MLPLDHPLWPRLGDAHRDRDVAGLIARLSRNWDGPAANSLFWECLCHQDTVYGATFAALPWVFRIAQDSPEARDDCLAAGYEIATVETLALEANIATVTFICRGDFE